MAHSRRPLAPSVSRGGPRISGGRSAGQRTPAGVGCRACRVRWWPWRWSRFEGKRAERVQIKQVRRAFDASPRLSVSSFQPQHPPFSLLPTLLCSSHTIAMQVDISRLKAGEVNLGVRSPFVPGCARAYAGARRPRSWPCNSRMAWSSAQIHEQRRGATLYALSFL